MPKVFTSDSQKTGEIGENIAVKFLMKQGFKILERNFTQKWGELDIVGEKNNKIHFIEVKSVSRVTLDNIEVKESGYRPEDNMHPWKLKRLSRTIQTYLLSKNVPENKDWQFDLIVVYLDLKNNKSKIKLESDIVL